MTIREFAERILLSESLEEKLRRVQGPLSDEEPGEPRRVSDPARSAELRFAAPKEAPAMPHPEALRDPSKRAVAHHIMANHELQAVEVMAWVLLASPQAPTKFRQGLVRIIDDEQRHTRMHVERAEALGLRFGALPVNAYIWSKARRFADLLDYLAGLPLVFEARNLDHTLEFADHFDRAGDRRSAAVMRVIHRDEIEHVRFGLDWLRRLKPVGQSVWEAYRTHLHWPLRPAKAAGSALRKAPRLAAGMSEEFIRLLEEAVETDEGPTASGRDVG